MPSSKLQIAKINLQKSKQKLKAVSDIYKKRKEIFDKKGSGILGINKINFNAGARGVKSALRKLDEAKKQFDFEEKMQDSIDFKDKGTLYRFSDSSQIFTYDRMVKSDIIVSYGKIFTTEFTVLSHDLEITTGKSKKHGITRAIVGGTIAGPAGAIVGAATGGSKYRQKTSSSTIIDGYQIRAFSDDGSILLTIKLSNENTARMIFSKLEKISSDNHKN